MEPISPNNLNIFIAIMAGFLTFFASCLLPLVPTYLAYLSGLTLNTNEFKKRRLLINSLIFVMGFVVVFTLLGISVTSVGILFNKNKLIFQQVGGAILIIMGIFMLDVVKPKKLLKEFKIDFLKHKTKWEKVNSFVFGLTFGFAWTPCIGPVLGAILFLSAQSGNTLVGAVYLMFFGFGLGLPFILLALFFEQLAPKIKNMGKFSKYLSYIGGFLIIITGLLMLTNNIEYITISLIRLLGLSQNTF